MAPFTYFLPFVYILVCASIDMEQPMAVGKLLIAMQQAQGGASLKGATINELESWLREYESLKEQLGQSIAHEETLLQKSNEVRTEKKKVKDLIESFTREHKDITGRMKQLEAQVDEAKVDRQQREVEVKQFLYKLEARMAKVTTVERDEL